uniref:Ig-like domain-containing protein n=1 Tax=Cairina moschata TaxID=8855 RepID=A0A8C3BUA8_CAIMO
AETHGGPTAPSVFPISSCCGSTQQRPVLGCLATGYVPGPVTFSWPRATGATAVTVPETHGAGPHIRASFLRPPHASRGDSFSCSVKHPATGTTLSKEVEGMGGDGPKLGDPQNPPKPPPDPIKPPRLEVPWTTSRPRNTSNLPPSRPPVCVPSQIRSPPEVQVLHSSVCTALGDDSVELLCVITGFSPPPVEVEWLVDGVPDQLVVTTTPPRREAGSNTYVATSQTNVSREDWKAGKAFTCQVKHPATGVTAQGHIEGSMTMTGKVSAPYIFTFPPHAEELSLAQVTLTCLVRGFQPEHVEVQWLRNHNSVPATEFVTTPPLKETNGDGTFFLYSKMTVPKASWQGGMSYACMVVHEGLPMKFTQRPLQKTPGK